MPSGSVHGSRWRASQAAVRVPGKVGKAEIAEGSGDDGLLTAAGMLQQINLCAVRMVIGSCRALYLLMAGWEWSEVVEVQEEQMLAGDGG